MQKSTKELYPLRDEELLEELNEFRKEYELLHGPTDCSVKYTSELPTKIQERMLRKKDPSSYFLGLPPFVLAYLKMHWEDDASEGQLDDLPDAMLRYYFKMKKLK